MRESRLLRYLGYTTLLLLGGGLLAPLVSYATLTLDSTSLSSDGALTLKSASSSVTVIGETNQTGAITIASSSQALTLNLGTGTAAATVNIATSASLLHVINLGTASTTISVPASTTFGGSVGFSGLTTNTPLYLNSSGVITSLASSTAGRVLTATSTAPYFTWQSVAVPTVNSSTFPTNPVDGQTVRLRAGNSPFDFIYLSYDATYGKWVSEEMSFSLANSLNVGKPTISSSDNTYTDHWTTTSAAGNSSAGVQVLPWRVLDAVGLVPQLRFVASVKTNVGGTTAYHQLGYKSADIGDDLMAASTVVITGTETTTTTTTAQLKDTGWQQITAGYTVKDMIIPLVQMKRGNTGGETAYWHAPTLFVRWVK